MYQTEVLQAWQHLVLSIERAWLISKQTHDHGNGIWYNDSVSGSILGKYHEGSVEGQGRDTCAVVDAGSVLPSTTVSRHKPRNLATAAKSKVGNGCRMIYAGCFPSFLVWIGGRSCSNFKPLL